MLKDISFAEDLLGKSLAKLKRKPQAKYRELKSKLEIALTKTADLNPPALTTIGSNFLFFNAAEMSRSEKPAPPQAPIASIVRPQLCIKSSALSLKKRINFEEMDMEARKRIASSKDDLSEDERPTYRKT